MSKLFSDQQSLLEIELDRLKNAVAHLERSNAELKQAWLEHQDREFKQALEENIVVIAKYRAQILALEEEIRKLKGGAVMEPCAMETEGPQSSSRAAAAGAGAPASDAAADGSLERGEFLAGATGSGLAAAHVAGAAEGQAPGQSGAAAATATAAAAAAAAAAREPGAESMQVDSSSNRSGHSVSSGVWL